MLKNIQIAKYFRENKFFLLYFVLIYLLFFSVDYVLSETTDEILSVEFVDVPLSELVILVSETSKYAYVLDSGSNKKISWVEQEIPKSEMHSRFAQLLKSLGMILYELEGTNNLYVIRSTPSVIPNSKDYIGIYNLKNIDAASLKDTSEILFDNTLKINVLSGTKTVLFTGAKETVLEFTNILGRIDIPKNTDILQYRLKNISVTSALKALKDTKLIEEESFYPDYWNRSVIVRGNEYERNVAFSVLTKIDKPQKGWVDRLEYVHMLQAAEVKEVLTQIYPDIEIRSVGSDKVLLSGLEQDVEKASVMLHKIDGTGLQVKVEAVIAYLTDKEFEKLGARLDYLKRENNYSFSLNDLAIPQTGLFFRYISETLRLDLAAEEGNSHGDILSSPVLTVLNGKQASIHVGQNVPFLTSANFNQNDGEDTATSIERHDVGLSFTVTPVIDPSGEYVFLTIQQEVSNITRDISTQAVDLIIDKKEIASDVKVKNGGVLMLGGVKSSETINQVSFVPLLGEIPFLGRLFTYKEKQTESRNLVVTLRVSVIDDLGA